MKDDPEPTVEPPEPTVEPPEPTVDPQPTVEPTAEPTEEPSIDLGTNEIIMFSIFAVFTAASIGLVIYGWCIKNTYMVISFAVCTISMRK